VRLLGSIAIHKRVAVQEEMDRLAAALDNEIELNSLLLSLQNCMLPEPEPESVTAPLNDTAPPLDNSASSNVSFSMGGGY
jgi:hypothetical protein